MNERSRKGSPDKDFIGTVQSVWANWIVFCDYKDNTMQIGNFVYQRKQKRDK